MPQTDRTKCLLVDDVEENLIALNMPLAADISRKDYEETIAKRQAEVDRKREAYVKDMESKGLDHNAIRAARDRAYAKAGRDLAAANQRLVLQLFNKAWSLSGLGGEDAKKN